MTDKKLTDNEIIKALECCMDEMGCKKGCPCFDPKSKRSHCTAVGDNGLEKLALDLINRLQAENERLNNLIAEANKFRGEVIHAVTHIDKIKVEAYKEFAERLKFEKATGMNWFGKEHYSVKVEEIDNLLKELGVLTNE